MLPHILIPILAVAALFAIFLGPSVAEISAQEEQQQPREPFNMGLHREMSTLTEAQSPKIVEGNVLFTFQGDSSTRYVAAAFEHEDFSELHTYQVLRNETTDPENPNETIETKVFALAYPVPEDLERLEYRIVADGLWQTDPTNPEVERGAHGVRLSTFSLPERSPTETEIPRVSESGEVEFIFEADAGEGVETIRGQRFDLSSERGLNVSVAGSFNNWDPYMHSLEETQEGVYRLKIRVPRGRHTYYFVVNGRRVVDPENPERSRHRDGFAVSSFVVP